MSKFLTQTDNTGLNKSGQMRIFIIEVLIHRVNELDTAEASKIIESLI